MVNFSVEPSSSCSSWTHSSCAHVLGAACTKRVGPRVVRKGAVFQIWGVCALVIISAFDHVSDQKRQRPVLLYLLLSLQDPLFHLKQCWRNLKDWYFTFSSLHFSLLSLLRARSGRVVQSKANQYMQGIRKLLCTQGKVQAQKRPKKMTDLYFRLILCTEMPTAVRNEITSLGEGREHNFWRFCVVG